MTKFMHFRQATSRLQDPDWMLNGSFPEREKQIVATLGWRCTKDTFEVAVAIPSAGEKVVSRARGRFIVEKRLNAEKSSAMRYAWHINPEASPEDRQLVLTEGISSWLANRIRRDFVYAKLVEQCEWLAGEMLRHA